MCFVGLCHKCGKRSGLAWQNGWKLCRDCWTIPKPTAKDLAELQEILKK